MQWRTWWLFWAAWISCSAKWIADLILGNAVIDFVRPGADSAFHALRIFETLFFQELDRFHGAHAALAVDVNGLIRIEFREPLGEGAQGQQWHPFDVRDIVFIGFANIDDFDVELRII